MIKPLHFRIFRALLPGACVIALALACSNTPASAASNDFKGWLIALDLALTQAEGLDSHIATISDGTSLPPTTERVVMDLDADVTWGASIGYNFGLDMGQVQVSYWSFDNDDSENFSKTGFTAPALFGYGYYGYMLLCNVSQGGCNPSLPVTFTGRTGVKASTWDLDYSRTIEVGSKFSFQWLGGLRTASFEEQQSFSGFDGLYTYQQARSWSADALGIRVGAAGNLNLTEHFGLRAGVSWSEMMADTDGQSSQTFVDGGFSCSFPPCTEIAVGEDDNLHGSILDLELKGVWSAGPVDISLGFTSSSWDGFVKNPIPATGFLFTSESGTDQSIGFTSFEVGLLWRIGAGHRITSP
jgi:major outer membrane protein